MDALMELNIWRAPTDNDRKIKQEWIDAGYDRSKTRVYDVQWELEGECVRIYSTMSVGKRWHFRKVLDIDAVRCKDRGDIRQDAGEKG